MVVLPIFLEGANAARLCTRGGERSSTASSDIALLPALVPILVQHRAFTDPGSVVGQYRVVPGRGSGLWICGLWAVVCGEENQPGLQLGDQIWCMWLPLILPPT